MKEQSIKVSEYLDFKSITKPGNKLKRLSMDFPEWMVAALDKNSKK